MRLWGVENWIAYPIFAQRNVLQHLVTQAQYTEIGRKYRFSRMFTVKDFKARVPIHEYDDLKPYIKRMMEGEQNILWNTPRSEEHTSELQSHVNLVCRLL